MHPVFTTTTASEAQTAALACRLAARLEKGDCVTLIGELGAGKTAFARGLIRALCGEETEVTSPTFALMQTYPAKGGTLFHCDFYRLEEEGELDMLGLEEMTASGIALIEWPEIAAARLPEARLEIRFAYGAGPSERTLQFWGGGAWRERLKGMV